MTLCIGDIILVKDSNNVLGIGSGEKGIVCATDGLNSIRVEFEGGYKYWMFEKDVEKSKKAELPPGTTGKTNLESKSHLSYFDPHLEHEMGMGMRYGVTKHGWNNHRELTIAGAQHILDSVKRHLNAYLRGEQKDPDMDVSHLACVVNNINFLYRLDRLHGYDSVLDSFYGRTK